MLQETGTVVSIEQDGLWVETLNSSACGKCRARAGCGQRLLASYGDSTSVIKALFQKEDNDTIWKIGDIVKIGIDEGTLVKSALLAYILPLVAMILSVVLSNIYFSSDAISVAAAIIGLLLGGLITSRIHNAHSTSDHQNSQYHAYILGHG